ncbi:MAG: hypothetical protein ACREUW_18510 [Burkholderiales bacterium]
MVRQRQERVDSSLESNWETLKDKVKESLDKVVEAVGTYPMAPDDLGLLPIMPVATPRKRKAAKTRPAARAAGSRGRSATVSRRAPTAGVKKGARGSGTRRAGKSA